MSPVYVEEMSDSDFPRGFEIISEAFAMEHEYFNQVFPDHMTPKGREVGAKRLFGFKAAQPYAAWYKAVDDSTGEMIGLAKWLVLKDNIPPETGLGTKEFWENDEWADYADHMYRTYLIERRKAIRESGGNLICLDLLVVDPKHFRKGAGKALVNWGLEKADELGVDIVVEASEYGRPAYESYGFKMIKFVTVEPPKAFEYRPRQVFWWMLRSKTK